MTLAQIVYIYRTKRLHSSNYLFSTQVTLISTQVLCSIKTTLSPPITLTQTQPTSNPSTPNSPYYSYSHLYSHHKSLILSQIPKPLQLSLYTTHSHPRFYILPRNSCAVLLTRWKAAVCGGVQGPVFLLHCPPFRVGTFNTSGAVLQGKKGSDGVVFNLQETLI